MPDSQPNVVELTVSELSAALKRTVEDAYGYVRVRGEISGYKGPHSSGHCYFALKDDRAKIDGVIWKMTFARMRMKPEEGMEVIVTGRLTTYPNRSSYQIVVETLEPAGVGALMALLEERKRKLTAEGLFDEARKQLLPFLPEVIGVVTSPTGAVIRDILHRLADRFPRHVIVWPVKVQGDGSAEQVAAAIRGFNALPEGGRIRKPDLLIVARGGGSLEDLWSFNEEIVVRAAAESMIPLISAVGHETDVTLIDFASDKRAPTPTAAAEIAVPVRADLIAELMSKARRALSCWQRGHESPQRGAVCRPRIAKRAAADREQAATVRRGCRAASSCASRQRAASSHAILPRRRTPRAATSPRRRRAPPHPARRLLAAARQRGEDLPADAFDTHRARSRPRHDIGRTCGACGLDPVRQSRRPNGARRAIACGVLVSRCAIARLCAGARRRRPSTPHRDIRAAGRAARHRVYRRPRRGHCAGCQQTHRESAVREIAAAHPARRRRE